MVPSPGFPLSLTIASNLGVKTKSYNLIEEKDWEVDLKQMDQIIDGKTKFILVNNPSNPLSSVWSEKHMQEILQLAEKHNLPLVCDEVYEEMVYPGLNYIPFAKLSPKVPILKLGGLTKRWLVPGWRMAWVVLYGKNGVMDEVKKAISNLTNILLMPNTVV